MESVNHIGIKYSQNGRELDTLVVARFPFFWTRAMEAAAFARAQRLVNVAGCGMAQVFVECAGVRTYLHTFHAEVARG